MKYKVTLTTITDMLGTVTKDPAVYDTYIRTRAEGKETRDEFCSPLSEEETEQREIKGWTGFMEEEGKPFVLDYMIRGFLKNAANIIKNDINLKNPKNKISNYVFVFPRKIFIDGEKGGEFCHEHVLERPLRAETMQGPRVTLARSDSIKAGAKLTFEIHIPYKCEITEKKLREILDYGQYQGLGQWRNASHGRFTYELEEIK
jgi:hypothetical protein